MDYKNLLEKYKKNQTTPEENKLIESDLEKYEALTDYLTEDPSDNSFMLPELAVPDQEVKKLSAKINFRILRNTMLALLITALVLCSVHLICRSYFYNPSALTVNTESSELEQIYLDMAAYTELHIPGTQVTWATASAKGFGRYDVSVIRSSYLSGLTEQYTFALSRNKAVLPTSLLPDSFKPHVFFDKSAVMLREDEFGQTTSHQPEEERSYQIEEIQKLPDSSVIYAYFTFKKELTLEEFETFYSRQNLPTSYAAVRTADGDLGNQMYGFNPSFSGMVLDLPPDFEAEYPYFNGAGTALSDGESWAQAWHTHFTTLLHYMSQQTEFVQSISGYSDPSFYEEALTYIEDNGVMVYGILVSGSKEEILTLEQEENIGSIYTESVQLSPLG